MSYARWGPKSDVYVYAHYLGHVECCGCTLSNNWALHSADEIVAHLREHVAAGDTVPERLLNEGLYDRSVFTPEAAV